MLRTIAHSPLIRPDRKTGIVLQSNPNTMKAYGFRDFGGPEVIEELTLPVPVPSEGEVLVRLLAATVNPTDLLMRSGQQAAVMGHLTPPYIDGCEFAGTAIAVGEKVKRVQTGQHVMGIVNPRLPAGGTHQEYLCVSENSIVGIPDEIDSAQAATIPMNGLTAIKAVEELGMGRGSSLLVTGAAGAVGGYIAQLAKREGYVVIADAKPEDEELLSSFGIDHVIPRGSRMPDAVRALFPEGVDGLIDAARIGAPALGVVRDGGVLVSLRSADLKDKNYMQSEDPERISLRYVGVFNHVEETESIELLRTFLVEGVLTPRVAEELPLTMAAEAHEKLAAGGLRGRLVLVNR